MDTNKLELLNSDDLRSISGGRAAIQYPQKVNKGTGIRVGRIVDPNSDPLRRSIGPPINDVRSLDNDVAS